MGKVVHKAFLVKEEVRNSFCFVLTEWLHHYIKPLLKVMLIYATRRRRLQSIDYRLYGCLKYPITLKGIFSKSCLCQYYCIETPRKSLMVTPQKCSGIFQTNHGSNTPQNNRYMANFIPSQKPRSKMNMTCRKLLQKQGRTHKGHSSMDPYAWTC